MESFRWWGNPSTQDFRAYQDINTFSMCLSDVGLREQREIIDIPRVAEASCSIFSRKLIDWRNGVSHIVNQETSRVGCRREKASEVPLPPILSMHITLSYHFTNCYYDYYNNIVMMMTGNHYIYIYIVVYK